VARETPNIFAMSVAAISSERTAVSARTFSVGLLGFGTVGSAFAALLQERAGQIERLTGRLPKLGEALTRSKGSFSEILDGSDLVVELIGGIEPAREYVLAALGAGKHVVTANKVVMAKHGPDLLDLAAEKNVEHRSVRDALDALPQAQRRTIELAYFGGYTHVELAELMGVPLGTVKGRMRIGLQKLRRALELQGTYRESSR